MAQPNEETPRQVSDTGASLLDRVWTLQVESWLSGERRRLESFLEQYPSLKDDPQLAELVWNEYVLSQTTGKPKPLDEYLRRFPSTALTLRCRAADERMRPRKPGSDTQDRFDTIGVSADNPSTIPTPPPNANADPTRVFPQLRAEKIPEVNLPDEALTRDHTGEHILQTTAPDKLDIPGYELIGELGRGGMGMVYKAKHIALNRVVALKMGLGGHLAPEQLAQFVAEAQAIAQLKHPNIVPVHDIGQHEGLAYFSLEFVEGGTLDKKIDRTPQPSEPSAALTETLAREMHAAHEKRIIHRDLKPGNVLLTKDGVPKITDFGLAFELDPEKQHGTGPTVGTPSYMAPEQVEGNNADIGPPTDVYALGAILYELITGRPPFKGSSVSDTLYQVLTAEPVPPSRLQPRCPLDLETICLKCLEKNPRKRYASALELANDLNRFQHGEPIHARKMGWGERLWRWCRQNPVPASLLLTVTLGSAFGMVHLSRVSHQLVLMTALESAEQEAEMFEEVNSFYSDEVVSRATSLGKVKATPLYRTTPGTIPVPATLTIDLGDHISSNSKLGMHVRLYSDLPFHNRKDGGVRDNFEQQALDYLRQNPLGSFYRVEDYKGNPTLRYARARLMTQKCVDCHNNHPDSPKKDWEVGDVRGVTEIIRPLQNDEKRTNAGLRGTFYLVSAAAAVMLLLSSLVLLASNRKRRKGVPVPPV